MQEWMYLKGFVDSDDPKVTRGAKERFQDLMAQWEVNENELNAIIEVDFKAFETLYQTMEIPCFTYSRNRIRRVYRPIRILEFKKNCV